jgi:nucleotide-binding universal stress UspA family protein
MRIAIAVDGSEASRRAVRHAIDLAGKLRKAPRIDLVHVDEPLLESVRKRLGEKQVARYHDENSGFALKKARQLLERAGIEHVAYQLVADEPALALAKFASDTACDLLVMGSQGRGGLKGFLLGSVAQKVIASVRIPVTLVR